MFIWFENIDRKRIQILFGLKKSLEYEYKYYYSASTIWIIFEYQIIRSSLVGGVLGRYADISETIFWKISISDKSVYILKLQ